MAPGPSLSLFWADDESIMSKLASTFALRLLSGVTAGPLMFSPSSKPLLSHCIGNMSLTLCLSKLQVVSILRAMQVSKIDRLHTFSTDGGPEVAKIEPLNTFGKTTGKNAEPTH